MEKEIFRRGSRRIKCKGNKKQENVFLALPGFYAKLENVLLHGWKMLWSHSFRFKLRFTFLNNLPNLRFWFYVHVFFFFIYKGRLLLNFCPFVNLIFKIRYFVLGSLWKYRLTWAMSINNYEKLMQFIFENWSGVFISILNK